MHCRSTSQCFRSSKPSALFHLFPECLDDGLQLFLVGLKVKGVEVVTRVTTNPEFKTYLFLVVKAYHFVTTFFYVVFLYSKNIEPRGSFGQGLLKLSSGKINAGCGNSFWKIPHEDIGPETIIHEVPIIGREKTNRLGGFRGSSRHKSK
jgi:hypothetical protein